MSMRPAPCILALFVVPALAAPDASVELLPRANVASGSVVLGQVARLHSDDLELMRKLVHMPVGRAPGVGDIAVLQRGVLEQWVRRRTGLGAHALEWSGAQESQVAGVAAQLPGEDIAQAAVETARAQLAASGRAGEVRARMVPRDLGLPGGEVRLEVRGLEHASWPRRMVAWVDVWAGDWFVRTVPVGLEIVAGAASASPAVPGMPLAPREERSASATPREPPAVSRGNWAVLRSGEGVVNLESRVEVLQDGRPGQKVRVRQQGANGPVLARVVGRGLLELAP